MGTRYSSVVEMARGGCGDDLWEGVDEVNWVVGEMARSSGGGGFDPKTEYRVPPLGIHP